MTTIWFTASFNVPKRGKHKAYTATKIIEADNQEDAQEQAKGVATRIGNGVTLKGLDVGLKIHC